jgi:ethanolaminephosphotransferase
MDNLLTPFWNKVVNYLPIWVAPNLVTFTGLLVTIISCMMYLPSDLTLTESFHPFYYAFSAISLFIY